MSKTELQDSELDQVSGGRRHPRGGDCVCEACGAGYKRDTPYPQGFYFREEEDGCGYVYYFKCPSCGYEWKD